MRKEVDKNSDEKLYKQVENILLELINEEPYSKGFYLPNELELMKRLNVSRHTVRKAMDSLVLRRLIIREKGRGTKVNLDRKKVKTTLNSWHSFTDEMFFQGSELKHINKKIVMEDFPDEIKDIFGLDRNREYKGPVLYRESGLNNSIDIYFQSYFNPEINLDKDDDFINGNFTKLYDYLEKNYGIFTVVSDEEVTAAMPAEGLKEILDINDKIPVLCRKRLVYDKFGQKIEYNTGYYRADRFVYNISLKREV
ncbi:MAG: GntR family transcriptional regulator [Fusobacteriales bacterium]|jgi:GntR family transcriptional regulator|nr:GntR family transcriptional regulator [Fusobacteriales bacterium]